MMSSLSPTISHSPIIIPSEQSICTDKFPPQSMLKQLALNLESKSEISVYQDINSIVESEYPSQQIFEVATCDNNIENYMFRSSPKRKRPDGISFSKKSNTAAIPSNVHTEIEFGDLSFNLKTENENSNSLCHETKQGDKGMCLMNILEI